MSFRSTDRRPGTLLMSFVSSVSEWMFMLQADRTVAIDLFRDILVELPNDESHSARDVMRTTYRATLGHLGGVIASSFQMIRGRLDCGNHEMERRFVTRALGAVTARDLRT